MYNATKYLRLSYTSDRANESDSIANQRKYIDEFVKRNPDIKIVNEQVDDGYSGIVFDRPAFKAMIEDIKSGKINCVIVKDFSRFGRNSIEVGYFTQQILSSMPYIMWTSMPTGATREPIVSCVNSAMRYARNM